mmetsp:Transcript_83918/g.237350  ORF Transcript_83918/g.237350 Transcript_83918/m.237350 type:complete len:312 (+) Transcript_83918:544-1479(+)
MADTFFANLWSDIEYTFTRDVKALDFAGVDYNFPFFWCWIVAFVLLCVCAPCSYCCCCRKGNKARLDKKKMGLAHAPSNIQRPHNPDEPDVELGKTTNNPVQDKATKTAAGASGGGSKPAKRKSVEEAKKSGEKPPLAKKKSARQSLTRTIAKALGREVEKYKPEMDEHGRTYYINQETGESVWEIPKEDGGKSSSPWMESVDESGRKYFYNTATGESRWTDPEADNSDGLPGGWQIIQDSSGRDYYYNATVRQGTNLTHAAPRRAMAMARPQEAWVVFVCWLAVALQGSLPPALLPPATEERTEEDGRKS